MGLTGLGGSFGAECSFAILADIGGHNGAWGWRAGVKGAWGQKGQGGNGGGGEACFFLMWAYDDEEQLQALR